jgi:hypothetical protein
MLAATQLQLPPPLVNCDARIVGDFLAQPGEAVKERRLSGIRRADQRDNSALGRRRRQLH